jgi:hypothetical protein
MILLKFCPSYFTSTNFNCAFRVESRLLGCQRFFFAFANIERSRPHGERNVEPRASPGRLRIFHFPKGRKEFYPCKRAALVRKTKSRFNLGGNAAVQIEEDRDVSRAKRVRRRPCGSYHQTSPTHAGRPSVPGENARPSCCRKQENTARRIAFSLFPPRPRAAHRRRANNKRHSGLRYFFERKRPARRHPRA